MPPFLRAKAGAWGVCMDLEFSVSLMTKSRGRPSTEEVAGLEPGLFC